MKNKFNEMLKRNPWKKLGNIGGIGGINNCNDNNNDIVEDVKLDYQQNYGKKCVNKQKK